METSPIFNTYGSLLLSGHESAYSAEDDEARHRVDPRSTQHYTGEIESSAGYVLYDVSSASNPRADARDHWLDNRPSELWNFYFTYFLSFEKEATI